MNKLITVQEALNSAIEQLDNAREAKILLSTIFEKDISYITAFPENMLTLEQDRQFTDYLEKRKKGIPLAYITGEKEFYSLNLKVNQHVLIPRPETELLVDAVLKDTRENLSLLDLGTGSGAIAIAVAKNKPSWKIYAIDISSAALDIAKENALLNKVNNVNFFQSDWYSNIKEKKFDIIVSNPPYIDKADKDIEENVARFEPELALYASNSGLCSYETILKESANFLQNGGRIIVEHGYNQAKQLQHMAQKYGLVNINIVKDLAGLDRVLLANLSTGN